MRCDPQPRCLRNIVGRDVETGKEQESDTLPQRLWTGRVRFRTLYLGIHKRSLGPLVPAVSELAKPMKIA
jgi:hypothetical protein